MRVRVIGGGEVEPATADVAETVGRLLSERGHELVCGGLGGVMEAACRGAAAARPSASSRARTSNPRVEVPIATCLGDTRNALVVLDGDAVVAIDG